MTTEHDDPPPSTERDPSQTRQVPKEPPPRKPDWVDELVKSVRESAAETGARVGARVAVESIAAHILPQLDRIEASVHAAVERMDGLEERQDAVEGSLREQATELAVLKERLAKAGL